MNARNSDIEKYIFNRFKGQYAIPDGTIHYGDKPDVILCSSDTKLGIEISQIVGGDLDHKAKQENVVLKAQKIYGRDPRHKTEFHFGFNNGVGINDITQLSKRLASLVSTLGTEPIGAISRSRFEDIPELSFVFKGDEYDDCLWKVRSCSSPNFLSTETVNEQIAKKTELSNGYKKCDSLWLLLFIIFIDPIQDIEIANFNPSGIVTGAFEKVFIYRTCFEEIIEINKT